MVCIKSGNSETQLLIDPTSKAIRATLYRSNAAQGGLQGIMGQEVGGAEIFHRPSYAVCANNWVIPATPTDMFVLQGSPNKNIRIIRIRITANQITAGADAIFYIYKRIGPNTNATAVPQPQQIVAQDSIDPPSSANCWVYITANPTPLGNGTLILARRLNVNLITATSNDEIFEDWGQGSVLSASSIGEGWNQQVPTLRGNNEFFVVNFNGVAHTTMTLSISVEWVEEPFEGGE